MVYGKMTKGITPLRKQKLSKRSQDKDDEIQKNYMKLIGIAMIGNSNYIGTRLSGSIQEKEEKTYSVYSKKFYC